MGPYYVPNKRGERDAMIAAAAFVHGMPLVARYVADVKPTGVPLNNPWGLSQLTLLLMLERHRFMAATLYSCVCSSWSAGCVNEGMDEMDEMDEMDVMDVMDEVDGPKKNAQ